MKSTVGTKETDGSLSLTVDPFDKDPGQTDIARRKRRVADREQER